MTKKYTGREISKRVSSSDTFMLDDLFWKKEEIEKHGLTIVSLE